MRIDEICELIKKEDAGKLRLPAIAKRLPQEALQKRVNILNMIVSDYISYPQDKPMLNKVFKQRNSVKSVVCKDEDKQIFHIVSGFGEGDFFNARRLFEDGEYPSYIQHGFCFGNAYSHLLKSNVRGKVVSGISLVKKPFLHSVVEIGEWVIDFNVDLVMSAELYYKLTNFEILAELSGNDIKTHNSTIDRNRLMLNSENISSATLNFAFEDVLSLIEKTKGYNC